MAGVTAEIQAVQAQLRDALADHARLTGELASVNALIGALRRKLNSAVASSMVIMFDSPAPGARTATNPTVMVLGRPVRHLLFVYLWLDGSNRQCRRPVPAGGAAWRSSESPRPHRTPPVAPPLPSRRRVLG